MLVVVTFCSTLSSPAATADDDVQSLTVTIGLATPLSGFLEPFGRRLEQAATIAINEINRGGGVAALDGAELALAVVDTGLQSTTAEAAVAELDAQGAVAMIGAYSSVLTIATAAAAERAGMPHLVDAAIGDNILDPARTTTFRFGPSYAMLLEKLVETIIENRAEPAVAAEPAEPAEPTIVIAHDEGPYGTLVAGDLTTDLAELDVAVAASLAHASLLNETDQLVADIAELAPQILVSLAYADAQIELMKALEAADARPPLIISLLGPLSTAPVLFGESPELAHDWLEVSMWPELESERGRAMATLFDEAGLPVTSDTALAFEAVSLIARALEVAGEPERQGVRDALAQGGFAGHAFGDDEVVFDETGQNVNARAVARPLTGEALASFGRAADVQPGDGD